jgi:hypothetical protein
MRRFRPFTQADTAPITQNKQKIRNICCQGGDSKAPMKAAVSSYQIETSQAETDYDINCASIKIPNASIVRVGCGPHSSLSALHSASCRWMHTDSHPTNQLTPNIVAV